MIGVKIKLKNHDTGEILYLNDHDTDSENVIALQSLPTFETEIRTQNSPKYGTHGEIRLPYYYNGKPLIFSGVIVGEDEEHVWDLKRQLDEVLGLSRTGYGKKVNEENITPPIAINESKNPTGLISVANWTAINSALSKSGLSILVAASSDSAAGMSQVADDIEKEEGDEYWAACDIENLTDGTRSFKLRIEARNISSETVIYAEEDIELASGAKDRIWVNLEALGANIEDIFVSITRISDENAENDDTFAVSRVLIMKNPPVGIDPESDYFDGETPDILLLGYDWGGTRGLSYSTASRRELASVMGHTLRVSFTDPTGRRMFIDATPTKSVSYDRPMRQNFLLNFQFTLRATSPWFLEQDGYPQVFAGTLGRTLQGIKLPLQVPFNLADKQVVGAITINVAQKAFAIIRMYGSNDGIIVHPKVTNLTNNTSVEIKRVLYGSHTYFLIDGIYQRMIDHEGRDVSHYAEGDYIYLEPGENVLLYTAHRTYRADDI